MNQDELFQQCWTKNKQTTIRAELKNCFKKINKNLDMSQNKLFSNIEQKSKQITEKNKLKNYCSRTRKILVSNKLNQKYQIIYSDSKKFQE